MDEQPRKKMHALFDFQARVQNELTFQEGDIISLIEKHDSGMWKGELNGRIGLFPYNFVEEVQNESDTSQQQTNMLSEGWLTKQGHIRKNWKRRWFIIKQSVLHYYPKPDDKKEKGSIPLAGCVVEDADSITQRPFSLHIFNPKNLNAKQLYVCADNAVEMSGWRNALEAATRG